MSQSLSGSQVPLALAGGESPGLAVSGQLVPSDGGICYLHSANIYVLQLN